MLIFRIYSFAASTRCNLQLQSQPLVWLSIIYKLFFFAFANKLHWASEWFVWECDETAVANIPFAICSIRLFWSKNERKQVCFFFVWIIHVLCNYCLFIWRKKVEKIQCDRITELWPRCVLRLRLIWQNGSICAFVCYEREWMNFFFVFVFFLLCIVLLVNVNVFGWIK